MFGMTNISASAEAARESARADNGQFAAQERSAPDVSLDAAAAAGEYSPALMERRKLLDAQMAAIWAAQRELMLPTFELAKAMVREKYPDATELVFGEDGDDDGFYIFVDHLIDKDGNTIDDEGELEDVSDLVRGVDDTGYWMSNFDGVEYSRRTGQVRVTLQEGEQNTQARAAVADARLKAAINHLHLTDAAGWSDADKEVQLASLDVIHAKMPEGVEIIGFDHDGDGFYVIEAHGAGGAEIDIEDDPEAWDAVNGAASNIRSARLLEKVDGAASYILRRKATA